MPITSSAKKALRQSERKRAQNQSWKERVRAAVKRVEKIASTKPAKNSAEFSDALKGAYQTIDKAAKNHIFHKNKAAHMKSRLARLIQRE